MWKAVSMLLLALGLAFSFSYVKAEEDLHHIPVTEQEFIVAYDPDLPPLHLENENLDGFSIEIFNEVAERTGLRIQYIPMSKEESLEAIREREIDMILSINFSEQDAEFMEFSESILSSSVGLVVPAEEENIEGITSLSGQVTALQRETIEYGFLRNVQGIRYQATSNQVTGLELLVSGRADAFVGNVLTAEHFFEERDLIENYQVVNNYVLPVEFSVGVQGEHYQLLHTINRGIREVKSDGTYTQIYENWFVDEEEQLISQLWRALQITGVLFLAIIILLLLGVRWNRQLKREVDKKTRVLNRLNQSLQYQVEQTKNSTEFQRQILNSSPRGIITINDNREVTTINPKAIHLLEAEEDIKGKRFEEHPLLKKLLEGKYAQVMKGEGRQFLGQETIWTNSQNESLYLRYYVYPLYNFASEITGIIFAIEDNTAEQMVRQQMFEQEKNQALSRVVAGIAHEIRNPLSSIKTFVELIPKKFQSERFQKQITTHVPREIDRLNQLIEGLIDYARPKTQSVEVVNLISIVKDCAILFERTVNNKGFILETDWPEQVCVKADPDQLKQVIINLMINGLDAMEERKDDNSLSLQLTVKKGPSSVFVIVKDEGPGITEEAKKKVFEPFYTTKAKGTGLGLSIAQQYVKENHGKLRIDGVKDKGTKVELEFPIVPCRGEASKE